MWQAINNSTCEKKVRPEPRDSPEGLKRNAFVSSNFTGTTVASVGVMV
jgi:hypothetical protein